MAEVKTYTLTLDAQELHEAHAAAGLMAGTTPTEQ